MPREPDIAVHSHLGILWSVCPLQFLRYRKYSYLVFRQMRKNNIFLMEARQATTGVYLWAPGYGHNSKRNQYFVFVICKRLKL